jgi:WD40 repeat protein
LKTQQGEHREAVRSLAISPDGQLLASGGEDKAIRLWSLPDGKLLQTLTEGISGTIQRLAFSPNGGVLMSESNDSMVRLWTVYDGTLLMALSGTDVSLSSDWGRLAVKDRDGRLQIWESEFVRLSYQPVEHTSPDTLGWMQAALQGGEIPAAGRGWLEFMLALVLRRRRFDIGVGEAQRRIVVGEFDIEIDG